MSDEQVEILSLLGNAYTFKAPPGQEQKLREASALLKTCVSDTKRQFPSLIGDKLLVLTALNLCARQLALQHEQQYQLDRYKEQVNATVERISRTLAEK